MTWRRQSSAKYSSVRCNNTFFSELAGRRFDSQLERRVAEHLVSMQRNREIKDLRFQDQVELTRAGITWRIDFSYVQNKVKWYEEAKGFQTADYMLKLKLYRVYGQAPLRITKEGYNKNLVTEEIYPSDYLGKEKKK